MLNVCLCVYVGMCACAHVCVCVCVCVRARMCVKASQQLLSKEMVWWMAVLFDVQYGHTGTYNEGLQSGIPVM